MKCLIGFAAAFAAAAAFGGFWDTMNKVQRTVETVNAVGEVLNKDASKPATPKAPAAVQAPSAQPAAQVPTAPAVSVPSVPSVPAADAAQAALFAGQRTTAADTAVPEVKYGNVYIRKPATPEQVQEAKRAYLAEKRSLDSVRLYFENVDDATLAAAIAAMPSATYVSVKESKITTLAPFVLLRNATQLVIYRTPCADLKPLGACTRLKTLEMKYCDVSDFSGLAPLQRLETLDLYGSSVTCSFLPLAACRSLRKVDFYAVKGPQSTYDSLGALTQVKSFHGGLTKMTSIKWLASAPQTEELQLFAEKIDDFTPIALLVNLRYFRGWNMDGGTMATALGDLSFLSACRRLKKLELPGSAYSNTSLIGTFTDLEELDLSNAKQPVDVSFVRSLPKLKRITLRGTEVVNGDAIPASVKIYSDKKTKGL